MVDEGPDLGAYDVAHIPAPRVAVVMGDDVSSLSFGEVWFTFEEVWNYPMTAVRGLDWLDWDAYDVVVLPRGWYDVDEDAKDQIATWVRDGGRLVAMAPRATWDLKIGGCLVTATTATVRNVRTNATPMPLLTATRLTPCLSATAFAATFLAPCTKSTSTHSPLPTDTARLLEHQNLRAPLRYLDGGHNVGILGNTPAPSADSLGCGRMRPWTRA